MFGLKNFLSDVHACLVLRGTTKSLYALQIRETQKRDESLSAK